MKKSGLKRAGVAIVLFSVVLAVISVPTTAGNLAVGSSHTTASELADGDREGLEIVGSGESAYLNFDNGSGPTSARYVSYSHNLDNAEAGFVNLSLDNATATAQVWAYDENDEAYYELTGEHYFTTSGNKTINFGSTQYDTFKIEVEFETEQSDSNYVGRLHGEGILFASSTPSIENSSATPNNQTINDTTLSIDVSDSDFATSQGDRLTIEWYGDGAKIGETTRERNGSASFDWQDVEAGSHNWSVKVTDSYGNNIESETFTFDTYGQVYVKNETDLEYSNAPVNATFYTGDDVYTREDTGNISISGLPIADQFAVDIRAEGYYDRRVIIDDFQSQQTVYLLPDSRTAATIEFELDDKTGEFPAEESQLLIERVINTSSGTQYVRVAGDDFDATGAVTMDLEQGQAYRIKVRNSDGDVRSLGRYIPEQSETEILTIGQVRFPAANEDGYIFDASVDTSEEGSDDLVLKYNDEESISQNLHVVVYERGNRSNVLFEEQLYGDSNNYKHTEPLTTDQSDTTWVVEWTVERDDEIVENTQYVGGRSVPLDMDAKWLGRLSLIFITVVGALHGGRLSTWGSIVMVGFAGIMMLFQWVMIPVPMWWAAGLIAVLGHIRANGGF